jgi:predicted ribosome quality control (RQC) complex YloA/Tae2 family protein
MTIRWDPLLARALARELEHELSRARLRAVRLDGRTRDAILLFRDRTLVWRLHPERLWPEMHAPIDPEPTDLRLRARLRGVYAPHDERIIVFEFVGERGSGTGYEVVIELLGNRTNAVVTEGSARTVRHVLTTREGKRVVRVGQPYTLPVPGSRIGIAGDMDSDTWVQLLEPVPPTDRVRELTRSVAWTSAVNAAAFLGADVEEDGGLTTGHERWQKAVGGATATPVVLETPRGPQPYPLPLPGIPSEPASSLLDAISRCVTVDDDVPDAGVALAISPALLERLERAVAQAERRVVRLQAQLDNRENPAAMRACGDLLLARFRDIPQGATTTTLTGFDGAEVQLELDPRRPPHENAAAYYDRAARAERAAERLPALIVKAEKERDRLRALDHAARAGTADAETVLSALPEIAPAQRRGDDAPLLPYRTYRSSGGLEIRVGRGAKQNDDLTFRHSAPDDIWLHARHTAGAHVILRWPKPGNPPARDLEEAGALAALHSRARTSASVPVDWTRRKHVRKPRKAPAGAVVPDRVSTVFVTPDESLLERLAEDGPS